MKIVDKLISFLEKGVESDVIFYFGFDKYCYHNTNSDIPTKKQFNLLKDRLLLILSLPFNDQINLENYMNNPYDYRKNLGSEFNWVRTFTDVINFKKNKNEEIIREFDPLQNT